MSEPIDRRAFMHRAAGAGAAVSISLAGPLTRQVQGANDRVRVGVIGTGRQGVSNLKAFKEQGAEIAAVCDVYAANLQKGKEAAGEGATTYTDFVIRSSSSAISPSHATARSSHPTMTMTTTLPPRSR